MSGLTRDEVQRMLYAIRTGVSISDIKWLLEKIVLALEEEHGPTTPPR